jgi:cyclic-di-GMP-binding protein
MKLHIPEQNTPAKGAIPNHPRKLKKWLASLPHANMGEMTRQIYSALRDLNRQTMPNRYRIENMELLREPVRSIFSNLEKYFINRTLPLAEKSQKIVNLNQSLLKEMSYGYKIIIFEAANDLDKKLDLKTQNIAVLRAIRYMSELLLRASEIYEPYPVGTWYDIHQMYAYAEQHGLHKKMIPDVEYRLNKASIEDYYKQVMLFALARPSALRQSDSERVYNKLAEWADQTKLEREAREHQINRFFCSRLDQDRPPNYLSMKDCDGTSEIRTLDTTQLVDIIRKEINSSEIAEGQLAIGDKFSTETLQILAMSWGVCAKRRFARADRRGHIKAAIGLVNAAREIAGKLKVEKEPEVINPGRHNKLNISLETIPEDLKASESQVKSSYTTHHEIGSDNNNPWDLVAKNKVLTEAYAEERQFQEDTKLGLYHKYDLHWEIVNVSAGGYCLRWNSDTPSRAQVGEPIALREKESDESITWRIGIIRWMQFIRGSGLEIGVQVLSPRCLSATVQRSNRPKEEPFECLMVPAIKALDLPTSVLLPTYAFRPGDKLKINILNQNQEQEQNKNHGETMEIQLDSVKEHTGSFTQFQFTPMEVVKKMEKQEKNKSSEMNKDNFDEIWSSL